MNAIPSSFSAVSPTRPATVAAPPTPGADLPPAVATSRSHAVGRWAARVGAVVAVVLSVIAAHAWAARRRGVAAGVDAEIVWSSVWLWLAIVAVAGLAWGAALSWSARNEQARLEERFRRDGAP